MKPKDQTVALTARIGDKAVVGMRAAFEKNERVIDRRNQEGLGILAFLLTAIESCLSSVPWRPVVVTKIEDESSCADVFDWLRAKDLWYALEVFTSAPIWEQNACAVTPALVEPSGTKVSVYPPRSTAVRAGMQGAVDSGNKGNLNQIAE